MAPKFKPKREYLVKKTLVQLGTFGGVPQARIFTSGHGQSKQSFRVDLDELVDLADAIDEACDDVADGKFP